MPVHRDGSSHDGSEFSDAESLRIDDHLAPIIRNRRR